MSQPTPRSPPRAPLETAHPRSPPPGTQNAETMAQKTERKRANIVIGSLNMNGLAAPSRNMNYIEKWSMINQTLNRDNIAILALQETHLDEPTAERIRESYGKKMTIISSADPNNPNASAGVAFVINKALIAPRKISTSVIKEGRALMIEVEWLETEKTSILNIYAPNNRATHPTFWAGIEETRINKGLPRPDFTLGDFNVTEDPIDRAPPQLDDAQAREALRDIKYSWEIQDEWRQTYPEKKTYTYRAIANGRQIQSRLDRIYTKRTHAPHLYDWKIKPSAVPTNHWLVTVKYAPKDAPEIGRGRWTLPLQVLRNKKLIEMIIARGIKLQKELENIRTLNTDREETNPQRLWRDFKGFIQAAAKGTMKETFYKVNSRAKTIEKDRNDTTNMPEFDTSERLRTHEAYLANELNHLETKKGKERKETMAAALTNHGEKLGGIWSAMSKKRKPRDLIRRLKIPNTEPPRYERNSKRMANLAKEFHDTLQKEDTEVENWEEIEMSTDIILEEIPGNQTLEEPHASRLNRLITETQVERALHLSKNGSATGLDGCPYELWKTLKTHHDNAAKAGKEGFNITKVLTEVINDIQMNGVDTRTEFAMGWMCPIYKKKDPSEIGNYRPITLLNTDYKILTKVLAIQLTEHIPTLVHTDQAGFIPKRSIFNHIRLVNAIINYAEATEEDGAIIALDQEKAYDKIKHKYLWATLEAFNLPAFFINTIKALYKDAETKVAINGFISEAYKIQRGIRQGDPLSCLLFDLGIEPLACMIRNDPNIKGISIPTIEKPIKARLFADDTNLFLSKQDSFDYIRSLLKDWCRASGAKFNIEKTEIIPIGTADHREQIRINRKVNANDVQPLDERIRIAKDGEAIRSLGAWIGNNVDDATPWESMIDRIQNDLERWGKNKPTMMGRKAIVQAIVGGHTQFLTKVQGMPKRVEETLTKIIRNFMWEDDSSPRIALEVLRRPKEEGGLGLLDIQTRNEAIEITWLKAYLDFGPNRPDWAKITDLMMDTAAPKNTIPKARNNMFLQSWSVPTRGRRIKNLSSDTKRMMKAAKRFDANLAAIRLTPRLRTQLPAWYHLANKPRPIRNAASKCLLERHNVTTVADLVQMSARIRRTATDSLHDSTTRCACLECIEDRINGCRDPQACAKEALTRIQMIFPKFNPLLPGDRHDSLSLTRRRKERNERARENDGEITFDPSITAKDNLAECFRIFTDPKKITNIPAKRLQAHGVILRDQQTTIHTDGACFHNGKANARCGSGVWLGPNNPHNQALRVPGEDQSNQAGEIAAVILAVNTVPPSWPLKIITDSKYTINGLTKYLKEWEDHGWIGIRNRKLFKKAAHLLKRRTAPTSFQWTKGHDGNEGNEASDRLAKEGAMKETPDVLDLEIPKEYDLQGAKLAALTQAMAYAGIRERKPKHRRETTEENLKLTREAIEDYNGNIETDENLWKSLMNPDIRLKIRQFLWKAMHGTQKTGRFWVHINGLEERQWCQTCHTTETMAHILIYCQESAVRIIWEEAKNLWPHQEIPWPKISLGIILGIGAISIADTQNNAPREHQQIPVPKRAAARLMRILMTESAHLIWAIRCERVVQEKTHTEREIRSKWLHAINKRLTEDRIIITKIKRDTAAKQLVTDTWEHVLKRSGDLPSRWLTQREFLVGRRER